MHGLSSRNVAERHGRRKRDGRESRLCWGFAVYSLVKDSLVRTAVFLGGWRVAEDCLWYGDGRAVGEEGKACSVDCTDGVAGSGVGFVALILVLRG